MALDDLLQAIEREAAEEAARLEEEARRDAEALLERASEQARELELEPVRAVEAELKREAMRRRAETRVAAAQRLRAAREERYLELRAELDLRLARLREQDAYPALLEALLREAWAELPNARVVRVDPRDEELAERLLGELELDAIVEPELETQGGLEIESEDGRLVRNTLEERLEGADLELRRAFLEAVEEEGRR